MYCFVLSIPLLTLLHPKYRWAPTNVLASTSHRSHSSKVRVAIVLLFFLPSANEVCEGYVFTGVCLSTEGVCMVGMWGMCGGHEGCVAGGHAWQGGMCGEECVWWGACVVRECAWWGACVAGGGHAWLGHVWQGGCAWQGGIHGMIAPPIPQIL